MIYIGNLAQPVPTIGYKQTAFDAIEQLVFLSQDHAFFKNEEKIIGVICLKNLLENYGSGDISDKSVAEFTAPLFPLNEYEQISKVKELMKENSIGHIAVTNQTGSFVGILSECQFEIE